MTDKKVTKVSMQNIADAAGVARSTVSFVLNGKQKEGRISDELAKKVLETAKTMNYQFNEVARSLRTGCSHTIALVVANIADVFFGTVAFHLQEYAEKQGYALIIVNTGEKKERLEPIFKMLTNRQVDGIIMVPISNMEEGLIESLNPKIPMIFIDRYFKALTTSRVIIDNYEISKTATQLLIGKGCKRIALITYKESLMHIQERKRGYIDALSALHYYDESLVCEVDYFNSKIEIADFLRKKLKEEPQIDGIFLSTGGISSIAVRCLVYMGIKVQKDIQVIGFGRMEVATGVPIPYVKQPMEEICKNSFDILLDQIKSKENKLIECKLPASIVVDDM
ncbi:LacI family DNA-binding transcriptional regulator [Parabacteroides pacaensis]|uniref:LacI family DNA-binding transcriptional regulator n=1 Tax=Parabacteroides pacaensis TaxID=2086575 RepID=UPI000D106E5D|nr:LacI family DNA-binding transcriptional regulator [Parabacteroides pacaensis]